MRRFVLAALALLTVGTVWASEEKVLMPGDKAPAMTVSKWVKGEKVEAFAPGKVYVVEFWATWCGPCRTTIPHLTELQKKYKDQVHFTGVSVYERGDNVTKLVEDFVTEWGAKMDYAVAIDQYETAGDFRSGKMGKNWMEAAKQGGIPTAFIVKDGVVQWIGHPMQMDKPLADVVAGTFDLTAFKAEHQKSIDQVLAQEAAMARIAAAQLAFANGQKEAAAKEIDAMIATGDRNYTINLAVACSQEAQQAEGDKAYALLLATKLAPALTDPIALFYAAFGFEANKEWKKAQETLEKASTLFGSSELAKQENMKGFQEALDQRIATAKKNAIDSGF